MRRRAGSNELLPGGASLSGHAGNAVRDVMSGMPDEVSAIRDEAERSRPRGVHRLPTSPPSARALRAPLSLLSPLLAAKPGRGRAFRLATRRPSPDGSAPSRFA